MAAVSSVVQNALGVTPQQESPIVVDDATPRRSTSKKSVKSVKSHVSFQQASQNVLDLQAAAAANNQSQTHVHSNSDVHQCSCGNVHATNNSQKLSAAGAAASLRRADPRDLPNWPTHGVQNLEASAGRAALLAAANSKSSEVWKAGPLPAAGAAASLAHNVRSPEIWKPDPSAAAGAAAVLAKDYKPADIWRPDAPGANANRAALLAHNAKVNEVIPGPSAASQEAGRDALSAASIASRPSVKKKAPELDESITAIPAYSIDRVQKQAKLNAERDLYNAMPPASQAIQDQNKSDIMRAASTAMSKKPKPDAPLTSPQSPGYYAHLPTTPKQVTEIETNDLNRRNSMAAAHSAHQNPRIEPEKPKRHVPYYPHLEEAAKRAATERLARLEQEHQSARGGVYSTSGARASMAGTTSDLAQSRKIKSDVARLQKNVAEVDRQRQVKDSMSLLAAAERNVKLQMDRQDDKIAEDQGRVPKHLQQEWDTKAKLMSAEYEKKRMAELEKHKGMIDMGGGLWYSEADVERIARSNVQPILDEISEKAAAERARMEVIRLAKEEAERAKKDNAAKDAELKAEKKKSRALEKEEAARLKAEQKEAARKSKINRQSGAGALVIASPTSPTAEEPSEMRSISPRPEPDHNAITTTTTTSAGTDIGTESPVLVTPPIPQATDAAIAQKFERELASEDTPKDGRKSWFGSIGRRLSRKDRHEQERGIKKADISHPSAIVADDHESAISDDERHVVSPIAVGGAVATSAGAPVFAPRTRSESSSSSDSSVSSISVKNAVAAAPVLALATAPAPAPAPLTLGSSAVQALHSPVATVDLPASPASTGIERQRTFESYTSASPSLPPTPLIAQDKGKAKLIRTNTNKSEQAPVMSATYVPTTAEPDFAAGAAEDGDDGSSVSSMRSSDSSTSSDDDAPAQKGGLFGSLMRPFSGFGRKEIAKEEALEKHNQAELQKPEVGDAGVARDSTDHRVIPVMTEKGYEEEVKKEEEIEAKAGRVDNKGTVGEEIYNAKKKIVGGKEMREGEGEGEAHKGKFTELW